MQYLKPPKFSGPSSNKCPKCVVSVATSVLFKPWAKSCSKIIADFAKALQKLGHPVPESNLSKEENNGSPEIIST